MYNAKAYSVAGATSPFAPTRIPRRDATDHDVQIEVLYCGICHSDLHYARSGSLFGRSAGRRRFRDCRRSGIVCRWQFVAPRY